jgi:hypothetical protein
LQRQVPDGGVEAAPLRVGLNYSIIVFLTVSKSWFLNLYTVSFPPTRRLLCKKKKKNRVIVPRVLKITGLVGKIGLGADD